MKKVYICCPTRYRSETDIKVSMVKMLNAAEAITGESLEPLNFNTQDASDISNKQAILNQLSDRIKILSKADYFVCSDYYHSPDYWPESCIEKEIADKCEIKTIYLDHNFIMSDMDNIVQRLRG